METRIVRVNGTPLRVPMDELPDPNLGGIAETCGATEPNWPDGTGGSLICTLARHDDSGERGTVHIAHSGQLTVLAIWGNEALPNPVRQARQDLRTLVRAIPEELQGERTSYASERLYEFIDHQAALYSDWPDDDGC